MSPQEDTHMDDVTSMVAAKTYRTSLEVHLDLDADKIPAPVQCGAPEVDLSPVSMTLTYRAVDGVWGRGDYEIRGRRIREDGSLSSGRYARVDSYNIKGTVPAWVTALIEHYSPTRPF